MDRTTIIIFVLSLLASQALSQRYNPTILQDSRDEPKVDGAFGFLYRTEDGISHTAQGVPGGQIHGKYSYTDPTGLKVNINYFAGSQATPGYTYDSAPPAQNQPQPERRTRPQSYDSYNEVNSNGQQYDNGQYDSRQYDNGQYDNNLYENPPYQQPDNQYQPAPYQPPQYQPRNNQYQPSSNQYQPSSNQYQPSNNQYQQSNNQYQPANNQYSNSRY